MVVPIPGRIDHEIASFEINFVAMHGAVGFLALDDEPDRLSRMAMGRSHFPAVEPLNGRP